MKTYRAAIVGCGRMGAFIDNEVRGSNLAVLPFSHAAGFEACPRTQLVAGSGTRPDVMEAFGKRYHIPPEHRYTDWRQMIAQEHPDILSIATQPEPRAQIILHAIEAGVPAIYAEKPLCASIAEASAIVDAVEKHRTVFNMGTNRRYHPGFAKARELIDSGDLGPLKTIVIYSSGTLFNMSSHWFDLAQYLNHDIPVAWAQSHIPEAEKYLHADTIIADPPAQGLFAFENNVTCHVLLSPRASDVEILCEKGYIIARHGGLAFELHRLQTTNKQQSFTPAPFPDFPQKSPVLQLIEDLVQSLDTGHPTQGGIHPAAANTHLLFAFLESHRHSGQRISLPLRSSPLYLHRPNFQSHPPKLE